MKREHHNLRLIIPSKENELFSITKYQKKTSDILTNSFFNTQYNLYNKIKYSLESLNNTKKIGLSLNETGERNNKTSYKMSTNTPQMLQIPYPSFPNKKPIPILYKKSIKLVKYPKIKPDNFTVYSYNKNISTKNKEDEKFLNTFSDNKMNTGTQTYLSRKNKTHYKEGNPIINLKISPIKKEQKIKYNYKLYKIEGIQKLKQKLKKKLNINNFDNILDNLKRLIEVRDESNKDNKYIEVRNLLLDEIYNLIEVKSKERQKYKNKKRFKSISTSISQKYLRTINDKFNIYNDGIKLMRKNPRFKTFLPNLINIQLNYSFNPEIGNKVEGKEYLKYENNLAKENASNFSQNNKKQKMISENIKENKNENNISEIEDDSDTPTQTLKSKYNLLNLMNERRGIKRRNANFDSNNNFNKNKFINNTDNNTTDYNNDTNYNNFNNIFEKSSNFIFNNFIKQGSKGSKSNTSNKSKQDSINILNLLSDLTNKIEKKKITKNNKEKQTKNKERKNENIKNNSIKKNESKEVPQNKEKFKYEQYFKNEKLINLIKQFSKFENLDEELSNDKNSEHDVENDEAKEKNNNTQGNDFNTIDDYVSHKNNGLGKIIRRKRKAKTNIIKKLDFGIELIKNICEEFNIQIKDKEDLFNNFFDLKKISMKPEISKKEEKIQKQALKTIYDFIKNYLNDIQKSELIKSKPKVFLSNYIKKNLNSKLDEILNQISENNTIEHQTENSIKKKSKKKPKPLPKKKLIYDNSYFFKASKEKELPLKSLNFSTKEAEIEEAKKEYNKPKSSSQTSKKLRDLKFKPRKALFKKFQKGEGLIRITPDGIKILTEEERKIEKENLLDMRLKAFFEEIKTLKNCNNNIDKLNSFIDKEMDKINYAQEKKIEGRKYNFYEELKIKRGKNNFEKKILNSRRYLLFQSPVIFNIHKDKV